MTAIPQDLFDQLCFYTMNHPDPRFLHQHAVDAFAVQEADSTTKPIAIVFGLAGLYLHLEHGYTGKQVQRGHMQMAARRRTWPHLALPVSRGAITVAEVVKSEDKDQAIEDWCVSVWAACPGTHAEIAALLRELLGIPTAAAPSQPPSATSPRSPA